MIISFNNCDHFTTSEQWNANSQTQTSQNSNVGESTETPQQNPMSMVTNSKLWPNEPTGFTKLFDCPFTDFTCGMWDVYKNAKYTAVGGMTAFDNSMEVGATTGGAQLILDLPRLKELYMATWWSTNANFEGMCNNSNKLFFVRNPDIDNNLLIWQGSPGQPRVLKWALQATYDNCGHPGEYGMCYTKGDGSGWFEPNGESNGSVAAGSGWHLIELYMKASSTKTSRDGIIRWYLDGKIVGNYPTVNMSPGGFTDFQFNHAWDGSGCLQVRDKSKAWHHYFDHLYISVR